MLLNRPPVGLIPRLQPLEAEEEVEGGGHGQRQVGPQHLHDHPGEGQEGPRALDVSANVQGCAFSIPN